MEKSMSDILEHLDKVLEAAEKSATMENASFGFPNDLIEIKSIHFGDDRKGHVGDTIHPTAYVKKTTELYRGSWIIGPIQEARKIIKAQQGLLEDLERLRESLDESKLLTIAEEISEKARAGMKRF